ncbi:MAG: hypothetical protein WCH58_00145 [Candidatus Saccharibacteria bacterium]
MKNPNLKATTLHTVLTSLVILSIVILAGGFYFAQDSLRSYAAQVNGTSASSTTGSTDTETLKQMQDEITATKVSSEKIGSILVSSQTYQTQVENDLKLYASANGVTISNLNLTPTGVTGPIVGGASSVFIKVTLKNPVSLNNLLQFMQAIDRNLPKMQIVNLNMTPSSDKNSVVVNPINLEVFSN